MSIVEISLLVLITVFVEYLIIAKCILYDLDKYCRVLTKNDTDRYSDLEELNHNTSLSPSFLYQAFKLISTVEREIGKAGRRKYYTHF